MHPVMQVMCRLGRRPKFNTRWKIDALREALGIAERHVLPSTGRASSTTTCSEKLKLSSMYGNLHGATE